MPRRRSSVKTVIWWILRSSNALLISSSNPSGRNTGTISTAPTSSSAILLQRRKEGRGRETGKKPHAAIRDGGGKAQSSGRPGTQSGLRERPAYRTKGSCEEHPSRPQLPTSLTNVRQMWLEITAKDEAGRIIMTSGTLAPDGTLRRKPATSTRTAWGVISTSP